MPDGPALVLRSKWNTRAWTYQEMIFSGSRLIFTDLQVYVEKRWNMFSSEAWNEFPFQNIGRIDAHGASTSLHGLTYILNEYSRRQLAKPSDVINAMQGILQAHVHRAGHDAVYNYWGALIPAFVHPVNARQTAPRDDGTFQYSLLWFPVVPSTRRQDFPSWSWTGWIGEVTYMTKWISWKPYDPKFEPENMDMWAEDTSHNLIPWDHIRSKLVASRLADDLTTFVELHAFTVTLRFEWVNNPPQHSWSSAPDPPYRPGFYVRCHDTYVAYSPLYVSGPVKRDDQGFTSKSWDCVVLGRLAYDHWATVDQHYYNDPFKDLCVMVIKWGEDGETAERIGLVNLGHRI